MPNRQVNDSMGLDGVPGDVVIRAVPVPPNDNPTVGVPVQVTPKGTPGNRLVVIGDSLSHGFQSGAVHNTHMSWSAIVAYEMGLRAYRYPTYNGYGGLPLNIEWLLHELEAAFGDRINWWEWGRAAYRLRHLMDEIEDWWERGRGSQIPGQQAIMHNLSVYGFDLRDSLSFTADYCKKVIQGAPPRDQFFKQIVENAQHIAALRVLESARDSKGKALSPLAAAAVLGKEGGTPNAGQEASDVEGIETLVFMLGANNALSSILRLGRIQWSDDGFEDVAVKNKYSVWRPMHFESELQKVTAQVKKIKARHVIFTTVPHVTIAPIARGVATKYEPGSRYFPFYTRPWIRNEDFNPNNDPHITANEARYIDSAIDQYNAAIVSAVKAARQEGRDWYIVDICGFLDRLASRRYMQDPAARPDWWTPYELPDALASMDPKPNCHFFRSGSNGRADGGIFSLDGVHPTTVGYGIIAQEMINVMQLAGVKFYHQDGQTQRKGRVNVDFRRLIAKDTLFSDPPKSVDATLGVVGWFDETLDVFRRLLPIT